MAITDEIERLQQAKSDIKDAIEAKGVTVEEDATLSTYDEYIEQIETGGTYQQKTVTPTAQGVTVTPDTGYDALSQVNVNGDANLSADNIKKDVSIFGVTGTLVPGGNLQSKYVVPTAESQTVTPDEGYDGLSQVDVYGDENLVPENIVEDVTIFGVTGTFSGGGGFPLERVGTTVTVEAQGAIGKGQPWEGVLNDEYAQEQIGEQNIVGLPTGSTYEFAFSGDRKVAVNIKRQRVTNSFVIYFFNNETSAYEAYTVSLPTSIGQDLDVFMNDEGTLVSLIPYNTTSSKYISVIEIDKEHKTLSAHSPSTQTSSLYRDATGAFGNFLLCNYSNRDYAIYYYNHSTHEYENAKMYNEQGQLINYTNTWGLDRKSPNGVKKYGDNTYIFHYSGDTYIYKFVFDNNIVASATRYTIASLKPADFPQTTEFTLSNDLTKIYGWYKYKGADDIYYTDFHIGTFNPQDLSFTYDKTFTIDNIQTSAQIHIFGINDNKIVARVSTSETYLIDINTETVKMYSINISDYNYAYYNRDDNWVSWSATAGGKYYALPKGSTAEYLIYPSHFYTENDKYYGIASNTLNIGDVGEAQLLFGE